MQANFDVLSKVTFLLGNKEIVEGMGQVAPQRPFSEGVIGFLNDVSRILMKDVRSKDYPDVITFAYWIRKGSTMSLQKRFDDEHVFRLGRGVVFHIAPSNVPVNFAYSMVAALLCGNASVVRVPSKEFPQVDIIADAFLSALDEHAQLQEYVACVRYAHDQEVNDCLSAMADVRVVWGGNETIAQLRKSPLPPRAVEVAFADRYSIAVIDADAYLAIENKQRVAEDFYNDTYLNDQNACTSPRMVVWVGNQIPEAKQQFWNYEYQVVADRYAFQPIQAVNKLEKSLLVATEWPVRVEPHTDNLIIRVKVETLSKELMEYRGDSGYFYEYECRDILDLKPLCFDGACQTVSYIGDVDMLRPLMNSGIKGIDRIVPVGRTLDFDLIWDGYNLVSMFTRIVAMQ